MLQFIFFGRGVVVAAYDVVTVVLFR